ncbi:MAG: hypothetical protein HYV32_06085 [Candidatus Kerfeldbacteria bacterium]|nr:hypothetical protein [Candidatus Kerfeldbacteria bacterium]
MRKKSFASITVTLFVAGMVLMGAGCGKQSTNTNRSSNTNTVSNSSATEEVTVQDPGTPTGNDATDEATIEETLNEMQDASDYATEATNAVESGDDADSYALPQDVE